MANINRVGEGFVNGDIIEFNRQSEPLYLYTDGRLLEITPQEYNVMVTTGKSERGMALWRFRQNK